MRRISLCAPESNETYEGIKRFPSSTVDPVSNVSVVPRCSAADRWIWVYATRVREAVQGTRHVCRHSSRDGCARSAPDGMVDHTHRTRRRLRCTARAFVTIASVPMAAVLLVAMFKVHLPYGFSSIKLLAVTPAGAKFGPVGYEVNLLYIACLAALVIGGPGPFAIDGLVRKRFEARTSTRSVPCRCAVTTR